MKKTVLLLMLLSLQAVAGLPTEIANLMNKSGDFYSFYNGKQTNESGGSCKIIMNRYGGSSSITIEANTYFTPVAHLDGAKKSIDSKGKITFTTNESGKRPGGSECGDYTPMYGYEKAVEIEGNKLTIRKKFRCLFEKNISEESCLIKK